MKKRHALVLAGLVCVGETHAGCGAAFCSASNDWLTLTQGVTPGWRFWTQAEYINQGQLRAGTKEIGRADITEHHEEIKTINRNFLLGAEYGFLPEWSVGVVVPYSNREHSHVHNHLGTPIHEKWEFDELGDVRIKLRYQPAQQKPGGLTWSLNGGFKLPTGRIDIRNNDGDEAERSVQPGTGSTDLLLGVGLAYASMAMPGTLFANLYTQLPLNEKDGYQPGWRTVLQAGWQYPVTGKLDFLLLANLLRVGKDQGPNAEPEESGRTEVAITPGLVYAWSRTLTTYVNLELPVYQMVNGVQLTHDYALSGGLSLTLD